MSRLFTTPIELRPDFSHMAADDLFKLLERSKLEFGDRVLFVLNRRNYRHVEKLLKKLRRQGRKLPCAVLLKRNPNS